MRELIELLKTKDHWELLEELSANLAKSSEIVKTIGRSFEMDKVGKLRQELPSHLVEAFILIEVLQVKLSILPTEWNKTMNKTIETLINENKVEESFDSMEF